MYELHNSVYAAHLGICKTIAALLVACVVASFSLVG